MGHLALSGKWLRVNRKLCEITGYTPAQLRKRTLTEITHPEDTQSDANAAAELLAGTASSYAAERRFIRANGGMAWVHLTVSLCRKPGGKPAFYVVVVEDVSLQKEADRTRALLAAIVENSADAIVSEDLTGRITSWNTGAERVFGYAAHEVLGREVLMLAPEDRADEAAQIFKQATAGRTIERLEVIRLRKGGRRVQLALSVSPLRDTAGKIIGIAKIARDITHIKEAEQALEEARRQLAQTNAHLEELVQQRTARLRETMSELEQMSYSIMHDMRAPLRAIVGYGDMVEAQAADALSERTRGFLHRMKTAAGRMDNLIRDVLNYSRLVQVELPLQPVNVRELIRGIVETYPAFQPPRASISIGPDLPWVVGNQASLTQCFGNLLDNAVKFVRPGEVPQIKVRGHARGDRVRISIADNGIGIPKELQDRVFGIFQRVSNSPEGTGIGLAIVRKAAERMGGTVGVESEPGRGSCFWIELAAAVPEHEHA